MKQERQALGDLNTHKDHMEEIWFQICKTGQSKLLVLSKEESS